MRQQKKKQRFLFLYRIYFIASFIPLAIFLQLTAYFYLSDFREYVTISQLFLLALLLGFAMYLRNNAFHYQMMLMYLEQKDSKGNERLEKDKSKKIVKEVQQVEKSQKRRNTAISDRNAFRNQQ